ncbi:T9SS type A sorting domain-containing protein [Flavobacterium selenitireducens]|uniref:T9SS type A sorting domain-containing protein n=1 Tax=Flavobacterium selenitireducens TaxID=2722704 RepID=UPI00168B58CB|nr:T9SS type A sorting domain-containing protein [Flavobacterium selenitireducens]MBD3582797.1 T9SS type A sorting domain-containing protein [Flavobacterium selenitireducens]
MRKLLLLWLMVSGVVVMAQEPHPPGCSSYDVLDYDMDGVYTINVDRFLEIAIPFLSERIDYDLAANYTFTVNVNEVSASHIITGNYTHNEPGSYSMDIVFNYTGPGPEYVPAVYYESFGYLSCFVVMGFDPSGDEDSDGILNADEDLDQDGVLHDDSDGDGNFDYSDQDDDDDGVPTIDEDYNGNGNPADDDTNSDGTPDYLDPDVALSLNPIGSNKIGMYPNPVSEVLYLDETAKGCEFSLHALDGKQVDQGRLSQGELNVSKLNRGVYLLRIKTPTSVVVQKLVKQ